MCLPMISSAVYPKACSAPLFQLVMVPSRLLLTIASFDDDKGEPLHICACLFRLPISLSL